MRSRFAVSLTVATLGLSGLALTTPALAGAVDHVPPSSSATATATDPLAKALSGLVADSTLTQAQADKVADTLRAAGLAHRDSKGDGTKGDGTKGDGAKGDGPKRDGGKRDSAKRDDAKKDGTKGSRDGVGTPKKDDRPAPRGGEGEGAARLASLLGLSPADLRTALDSGQTLAQIAQKQNVTVDALVQAMAAPEAARITKAVADGKLTQAQADKQLAFMKAKLTEIVNTPRPSAPAPAPTPAA